MYEKMILKIRVFLSSVVAQAKTNSLQLWVNWEPDSTVRIKTSYLALPLRCAVYLPT
jgi:hypothetical protein